MQLNFDNESGTRSFEMQADTAVKTGKAYPKLIDWKGDVFHLWGGYKHLDSLRFYIGNQGVDGLFLPIKRGKRVDFAEKLQLANKWQGRDRVTYEKSGI